jgi:histidinol-phosphate aminotransferase
MHAYAIQPSAGLVKLDAMENPFALPPELQHALGERLGRAALNRYPAQRVADLAAALTAHVQLPAGQRLMLGNGSDELIDLLAVACDVPGATILAPVPSCCTAVNPQRWAGVRAAEALEEVLYRINLMRP